MIYRKLDANGDYSFGGNAANYVSGVDAVAQAILTRLRLLKYEWWENLEDGLPLWQDILAQRDVRRAEQLITERISMTPGVRDIMVFDSVFDNNVRRYSFNAVVNTDYGAVTLKEVQIG